MTSQKNAASQQQAKTDLSALYRPLGLKAVLAAALMQKSNAAVPAKKAA